MRDGPLLSLSFLFFFVGLLLEGMTKEAERYRDGFAETDTAMMLLKVLMAVTVYQEDATSLCCACVFVCAW